MKDFKNKNGYGNMKTEDVYDGILLKRGDEGYRYYSSSNSSTSSASSTSSGSSNGSSSGSSSGSASGSYNCSYCLGTGWFNSSTNCSHCDAWRTNLAPISYTYSYEASTDEGMSICISGVCGNAQNMYIYDYTSSNSSFVQSEHASANRIKRTMTFTPGTHYVKIKATSTACGSAEQQFTLKITGKSYDCTYCKDTGKINTGVCTQCYACPESLLKVTWNEEEIKPINGTDKAYVPVTAEANAGEPIYLRIVVEDAETDETVWQSSDFSTQSFTASSCNLQNGTYNVYAVMTLLSNMTERVSAKRELRVTEVNACPAYPEGFSYAISSYDEETGTCDVTMRAKYSDSLYTYMKITNEETEKVIYEAYKESNVTETIERVPTGNYIAKTGKMDENYEWEHKIVSFSIAPEKIDLNLVVVNERFDMVKGKYCIEVSASASSNDFVNNIQLSLYDREAESLVETPKSFDELDIYAGGITHCYYLNKGIYELKVESSYIGSTYYYGFRDVLFAVDENYVGHELSLTDIAATNAPGGGGGSADGDDTTTPEVEDDTNVTYNIQHIENNTFNLTIDYNGEKAIAYDVVPKYIRNTALVVENQSGGYTSSTQIELYEGVYRLDITTVEGNELLKKQLFAVEEVTDESRNIIDRIIHYNTAQPERKFLLLYVTDNENAYDEITSKIVDKSGATDIVILTNYPINHCEDADGKDVTIMNSETIENDLLRDKAESEYPFNSADKHIIISQMKNAINHVEQTWQETYEHYMECVKNLKKSLLQSNKSLKIWVGLPQMVQATNPNATEDTPAEELNGNCTPAAELYTDCYTMLVNNILSDTEINDNNFEGFYYGEEAVPTWYTKFDYDDLNNFNNVVVDNMDSMSNYIRGDMVKKKFMWIPYYQVVNESGDDNIVKRTRSIVNELDLFDYIILQPSSYFNYCEANKVPTENIEYVRKCVEKGKCLKKSEAQAFCNTYTTTGILGMEMEIDSTIEKSTETGETARALYGEYVFQYLMAKNRKAPVAFYAGNVESVSNTTVLNEISELYT